MTVTMEAVSYGDFWVREGLWTEEDYLALPPGGPKLELIDGSLIVSPAPRKGHQRVMQRLAVLLDDRSPAELDVVVELNVHIGAEKILIPDVVATYEQGDDVLVHAPDQILLVAEVLSPSNSGFEWAFKSYLYAKAGIPWYLLVDTSRNGGPLLVLQRLDEDKYVEERHAVPGETLTLPEPLGTIDPADLLGRR